MSSNTHTHLETDGAKIAANSAIEASQQSPTPLTPGQIAGQIAQLAARNIYK